MSVIGAIVGAKGRAFKSVPMLCSDLYFQVPPSRRFATKLTSRLIFLGVILEPTSLFLVQMVTDLLMLALGRLVPTPVLKLRTRKTNPR